MVDAKDVSIVIPAYNEEHTIRELLAGVFSVSRDFEVIVCVDGAVDKTAELARMSGAIVVEHPYNIGNGAAIKSGAQKATRNYIVFMDADLQHRPEDIPRLLEFMPKYDMVVGARTRQSKTDLERNFGNIILNMVAEKISGYKIEDLTSGFRVVKRNLFLKFTHLYPLRYSYPSTITLAFFYSGYFVKYVPMDTIVKREKGKSNIAPFRDGVRFLNIIMRIIMTFSPQSLFNPVALICFVSGLGISVYQLLIGGAIRSLGIILLVSSVVIFFNGLLADQMSRLLRNLYRE